MSRRWCLGESESKGRGKGERDVRFSAATAKTR